MYIYTNVVYENKCSKNKSVNALTQSGIFKTPDVLKGKGLKAPPPPLLKSQKLLY